MTILFHALIYLSRTPVMYLAKEIPSSQYRFNYRAFKFNMQDSDLLLECSSDLVVSDGSILNTTINSSLIITKDDLKGLLYAIFDKFILTIDQSLWLPGLAGIFQIRK